MRKLFIYTCLFMALQSCKAIIEKKYGMNKPFRFSNRTEYMDFLGKNGFPISNILYVDDSASLSFYQFLSESQLTAYYGSFLNDSTEIRKTDSLQANLSCAGRVIRDIHANVQSVIFDSSLLVKSNFKDFSFRRLDNNQKFLLNESPVPLKIVMIYGYSLGTFYDPMYNEILQFYKENKSKAELYIISLDPVSALP